jgi:hypothetical protein
MKYIIPILTILFLFSCGTETGSEKQEILSLPFKQLKNYYYDFKIPVEERIREAPQFLLDQLMEWDNTDDYIQYMPTEREWSAFRKYINILPDKNLSVLEKKLVNVYFVDNFKGSGMAEYIFDENEELYCILIINSDVLHYDMSSWLTLRENSCFKFDGSGIKIRVQCGTEFSGLLYVLLHETTHIVDYTERITPYCEPHLVHFFKPKEPESVDFTNGIWSGYNKLSDQYSFPEQESISFYGLGGPNLEFSQAVTVWKNVAETPAASLYGCMSWAEDLAEYITWYHYTQVLKRPYKITISKAGTVLFQYEPFSNNVLLDRVKNLPDYYKTVNYTYE